MGKSNTKKKAKDKKDHDEAEAGRSGKMKRKEYEREMRILQGELVAMQEWVKTTGARVCIVFEGVDSAGKGGTIRRITERTSPRVFKHIALPAPDARVRSQMYIQRAGSTVVETAGSHSIYVSQPSIVADLVVRAASEVA
jgi:polyphosphate kinase 2 (PPK2 family)